MKKKLLALVCALALTVSLVGCALSTPDTVGKIGDFEVTSGLYLLAQYDAYQQAAQLADSEQDTSKVNSFLKATITTDADTGETAVVKDYVAQKTLETLQTLAAVDARFAELVKMLGLGLETRMTAHVGLLSGGQRQALTLLMATLVRPKLLLLDEHTAALDPKTAAKVLEITERLVTEQKLTTLMITHNMRDALRYGNRLIMMHDGRPILDVRGEEKAKLTTVDLLKFFEKAGDGVSDKMLLAS